MINKILLKNFTICFVVALVCFFTGCFPGAREEITKFNSLKKLNPKHYPEFIDNFDFQDLAVSIDNSLKYFKKVPLQRKYQYGKQIYNAAHLITSLETFKAFLQKQPSKRDLNTFIKSEFIVYESAGNDESEVLFTGYFEPTYQGSLKKSDVYQYSVYSTPDDLLKINLSAFSDKYKGHKQLVARLDDSKKNIIPYYSRKQINAQNDFHIKSEPVVWLKNRVDRFFLEIQGSGRIVLEDQAVLHLHYAISNGNAYSSIGRYLIEKNEILKENMSMQAIRRWLELNPDRIDEVLHHNDSFVFFQKEEGGPYGCLGVEVTPLRSIATDTGLFPKGALCFLQSRLPDKENFNSLKEWDKASLFVLNQDTGGAIKGPARADLFCGNSEYAEFAAGHMNQYGKLFFLVLNPDL